MRPKLLTELIPSPNDLDYVEHFQTLSQVNLAIRNEGPTKDLLLRKAILEMDIGNHEAGLEAVQDASVLAPHDAEILYQTAVAYLMLAYQRAGALPIAPGTQPTRRGEVRPLLERSAQCFADAAEANPDDDEAQTDLQVVEAFLESHPDDDSVRTALAGSA